MQPQISILGAAKSGIGAAALAKKVGLEVFVSDYGSIKQEYKTQLEELGVQWEENGHSKDIILGSKEVIKSPGIADDVPIVKDLIASQIPVISEIEFAGRYSKGKKICITGSNGKTTTTLMLKHILSKAGLDVVAVGNVGNSFAQVLSEADHDFYVIELSSFQLDNMHDFKADIAILLNITPDHLEEIIKVSNQEIITGLIISNTTIDREQDLKSSNSKELGGLSGAPLFLKSTNLLSLANQIIKENNLKLYLIAAGGISDCQSAYAKILCGAHLIQLYTSMTYEGPLVANKIIKGLLMLMKRDNILNIDDIRGIIKNPETAMKIAFEGFKQYKS